MFSRLFKWFSGRPAPSAAGNLLAFAQGVGHISATDNPWGVDILDCRAVAKVWRSATSDSAVASKFNQLRVSDGRQHIGAEPLPNRVEGHLTLHIPVTAPEGMLFRSTQMEDKWDIFHFEGRLYVARSWTGALCYTGRIHCDGTFTTIDEIQTWGNDAAYAKKELHFLMAGMCQYHPMPAPLPVSDFPGPERRFAIAHASQHLFSSFGRFAWFATVADLTEADPVPIEEVHAWLGAHP